MINLKKFDTVNAVLTDEGLTKFIIENDHASAEIYLQGAHLTKFQPRLERPIVWMGEETVFGFGESIRGGIPICWPWFGAHPTDKNLQKHGFARDRDWFLAKVVEESDATSLTFTLESNPETKQFVENDFLVTLKFTIGKTLKMKMTTTNLDDSLDFTVGGGFHTYCCVSDIANIKLTGLENCDYLDAADGFSPKKQTEEFTVTENVDRVFTNNTGPITVEDSGFGNNIVITKKSGSKSDVVWNPWTELAKELSGFGSEEYKEMVCVETTNILEDVYTLKPQKTHSIKVEIGLK